MARVLHFVPRAKSLSFSQRARMLAELTVPETPQDWTRVVEMFNPSMDAVVYDLAFDETHTPEVITALRSADAIHVHGLSLELALRMLPYVPPETVHGIPLYLHGPVARGDEEAPRDPTRLATWPGPVICDQRVDQAALARIAEQTAYVRCAAPVWLDPADPELLPRACGPLPLWRRHGDGRNERIVFVSCSPHCPRELLSFAQENLKIDQITIEWLEEHAQEPARTRANRRAAQAALVIGKSDPWLEEAVLAGLPTLVLQWPDLSEADVCPPPGLQWVTGDTPMAAMIAALTHLREWAQAWIQGRAAPVDVGTPRAHVVAHTYAHLRRASPEVWPLLASSGDASDSTTA